MTTKEIYLQYMSELNQINKLILAELIDIIGKLPTDKDGNLVNRREAKALVKKVNEIVENVLKDSGYFELTSEYFESFDIVEDNLIQTHLEVNAIKVKKSLLTPQKKYFIDQAKASLLEGGIVKEFTLPVEQSIYSFVRNNSPIIKLEKSIRASVEDSFKRWAGEAARDAIFGYQGSMHDAVKAEYDLNGFIYIGSIRLNTRSQCKKWLDIGKAKDDVWTKEIAWAKRGGTYNNQKVRGFVKSTNIDNFSTHRGGFNCLHEAVPTNIL